MTELVYASEFFMFDFRSHVDGADRRIAVAFCSGQFEERRFVERVRRYFDHRLPPDRLVLIGEPRLSAALLAAASSAVVNRNLPAATRYFQTPAVVPLTFDEWGSLKRV